MVSVIIPVYNAAPYLVRCLDSVLRQTYTDLEVVLVDDGSTDGSAHICDEYVIKDKRVRVIHQQNKGASIARKQGIERAQGEWLTFVDSDDVVEDDYVERLYKTLRKYDVQIAACDQVHHVEGTELLVDKTATSVLLDEKELHERFFHYQFWGFWGKVYHRSVFEGIYFPEYTINEDYVVMAQLFYRYKKMAYVPIGLYHYMTHAMSLSHQPVSRRMFDEYHNKMWTVDFYRTHQPRYVKKAEAQLAETCIKLTARTKTTDFQQEQNSIRQYLRQHIVRMMLNPYLLLPLKLEALKRCLLR